jgi:hypothetical protein
MIDKLVHFTCEIDLQAGEKLSLPPACVEKIGAGRWLITVRSLNPTLSLAPLRNHSAFLSGYAPQDEGLYDDYPGR